MSEVKVPLIDLKAQYAGIQDAIDAAIARVVASQRFVLGPEVEAFEEEIAAYCGVPFAVACGSGSDAILLALMAHGVGAGDDVLCPSYTFFSSAGSIARLGANPVFCDIDPDSYTATATSLREAVARAPRLKAMVVVHLFGAAAEMDPILTLARELGVPIIEDGAQALGARDETGVRVGTRGSIGCFSFFPTKNLGGYGDGGLVTTADARLATRLRALRIHGEESRYEYPTIGLNSRLDALQAAVLRVKLPHLDGWSAARRRNAAAYTEQLGKHGAGEGAGLWQEVAFPLRVPMLPPSPADHIFNQYVIRVPAETRDALREHLTRSGIGCEIYYPKPLHRQRCFDALGYEQGDLPEAERAARETLALPVYPELSSDQISSVVAAIEEFGSS